MKKPAAASAPIATEAAIVPTPRRRRRPWQRLVMSLLGVLIIELVWRWAVNHLYTLPEHSLPAFQSLTNTSNYSVTLIVFFLVTGKVITELKNGA